MNGKLKQYFVIMLVCLSTAVLATEILRSSAEFQSGVTLRAQGREGLRVDDSRDLEKVQNQVAEFGRLKDLVRLEELERAVHLGQPTSREGVAFYMEAMINICSAYDTYDFGNPKQYVLARRCAKEALTRLDEMPVGRSLRLVAQLGGDTEYVLGAALESDWPRDRTERAEYWFRSWKSLNAAIISGFDQDANRPVYHSGMTTRERNKAEEYNRQRFLQRDRENYLVEFRRFVVDAYSRAPQDNLELIRFLNVYVGDVRLRNELLTAVEARISSRKSPAEKLDN